LMAGRSARVVMRDHQTVAIRMSIHSTDSQHDRRSQLQGA
jgi:hypothetical protein